MVGSWWCYSAHALWGFSLPFPSFLKNQVDFFFSMLANVNILVLAATEMQWCFRGREWSNITNRKSFSTVSIQRSEKLEGREISLEYEGCLVEPLLELEFFGTDFVISAQSWSFQVFVCLFNVTSLVQHSIRQSQKKNPSSASICQHGWIKGRVC